MSTYHCSECCPNKKILLMYTYQTEFTKRGTVAIVAYTREEADHRMTEWENEHIEQAIKKENSLLNKMVRFLCRKN